MSVDKKTAEDVDLRHRLGRGATGVASGALAGGVMAAAAGPAAAAAGAVIGGIAGALVAKVLDDDAAREAEHERELDQEIGVIDGDLGTTALSHPPPRRGAFSATSAGMPEADLEPAEGPFEPPPSAE